jgi:hypothetical protein
MIFFQDKAILSLVLKDGRKFVYETIVFAGFVGPDCHLLRRMRRKLRVTDRRNVA